MNLHPRFLSCYRLWICGLALGCLLLRPLAHSQALRGAADADTIAVHAFFQFSITWKNKPSGINPFTEVQVSGTVQTPAGQRVHVQGFCDSQEGKVFRLRFMPQMPGTYGYQIEFVSSTQRQTWRGTWEAVPGGRLGVVEVSDSFPTHFRYRHSPRYFFWNGTTAYWLAGWKDPATIDQALERLASLGVNRVRVGINGRSHGGDRWHEPTVVECPSFTLKLNPWVATNPASLDTPGFDVNRMQVAHWQALDHIMQKARSLDIVVALIFYVDGLDHGCDPFKLEKMGSPAERLYYQYAINRFAAYPNLMWDVANEYHLFRTPEWAEAMGQLLKQQDPYGHLISVHGSGAFPFRQSTWADVVMFQSWDECGGYDFIADARNQQAQLGLPKPVVNEEYGYEDHYPPWGCGPTAAKTQPDGRSALNRAMLAWEIYMAGGYQTTGETAKYGTGAGEDSGGGWINGRGNDRMVMLHYYQIIRQIFEQTTFWRLQPANHLTQYGNYCLAWEGVEYLLLARNPHCRVVLPEGIPFAITQIDPLTGETTDLGLIQAGKDQPAWQYPRHLATPTVFFLKRITL